MTSRLTAYKTVAIVCTALGLCTACFYGGGVPKPPPPPALTISPPSHFVLTAVLGSATAPQFVSIINITNSELALAAPKLLFNPGQAFRITTTCGKALAANAQCTVSAVFQPRSEGRFHAIIELKMNKPYEAQYVYLTGTTSPSASTSP